MRIVGVQTETKIEELNLRSCESDGQLQLCQGEIDKLIGVETRGLAI